MSFILSPGIIVPPLTAGGVAYGNGTQAFVSAAGTVGQVLTSAGAGTPVFTTPSSVSFPITVPQGGTNLTTLTANNVILGNGASAPNFVAPGASGNVLSSDGSTWASTTPAVVPTGITFATKTANYTAVSGDSLLCNTSAGAFTVTLPSSPSLNNQVYFQDSTGSFSSKALTINPGSNNIMGASGNLVSTLNNAGFGLFYNGSEWRIW